MKKQGYNKNKYYVKSAKEKRRATRKAVKKVFPSGIKISVHATMRFFERKMNTPPFKDERHFLSSVSKEQIEAVRDIITERLRNSLSIDKGWWLRDDRACYAVRISQSMIGVVANSVVVSVYYIKAKKAKE